MKCPNCEKEVPNEEQFGLYCGTKIEVDNSTIECPMCHNRIPKDSKFCPDCGSKVNNNLSLTFSKLFPVYGMTLGETTIDDIEEEVWYLNEDFTVAEYLYNDGIHLLFENQNSRILSGIWIRDNFKHWPDKWKYLGMDPHMSYDFWLEYFKTNNFDIYIWHGPTVEEYNGRKCFSANLFATSLNEKLQFSLGFGYGNADNEGFMSSSVNSLYQITIRLLD